MRRIVTSFGTGKSESKGARIHCVPVEISFASHTSHFVNPTVSEYSLFVLMHAVQFGELTTGAIFPASQAMQEMAPDVLALPASHGIHLDVGGISPI